MLQNMLKITTLTIQIDKDSKLKEIHQEIQTFTVC